MTEVMLATGDWQRNLAQAPSIPLINRYFERTPDPVHGQVSLIARPGLRRIVWDMGEGPIRGTYSEPGTFSDCLFAVSGDNLYRVSVSGIVTLIGGISTGNPNSVRFAATPNLSPTPEFLFLTDGGVLWLYMEEGQSLGQLQATGAIANNDQVVIDGVYYKFTNGSVDAGTPAGTAGNPWLVKFVGQNALDLQALFDAINDSGVSGTDYSTALTEHATVQAYTVAPNDLYIVARVIGVEGDAITTTETGANLAWGGATLSGGGDPMLRQVPTPDDVEITAVAQIAGYVIAVVGEGAGQNGRFYWIDPGQTVIDPLDFATAERAPDACHSVRTVGDQFWLLGNSSVEPWYLTGSGEAPFARQQSRVFDRGVWEGTDVQLKDAVVVADRVDGVVYALTGGGPQRISNNAIEEAVRKAMAAQKREGA